MLKIIKLCVVAIAALLVGVSSTYATNVSVTYTSGTNRDVLSLTSWTTRGVDMSGLSVTALFDGGGSEEIAWTSAGALGTGWSLTMAAMNGSTFSTQWILDVDVSSSLLISGLIIDGGENVVFDTWFYDKGLGTTNSEYGLPLTINEVINPTTGKKLPWVNAGTSDNLGTVAANYSGSVSLLGVVYGDLFQQLTISFDSSHYLGANDKFSFWSDTDNIQNPVPEPATMFMLGIGLTAFGGYTGFRRKSQKK